MAIDLSSLDGFDTPLPSPASTESQAQPAPTGQPMEIPLADIEEDPNQPRREFSADSMAEMVASIKATGVKTPVSLRPNPAKPGKWLLNFGARRYRGSKEAGKKTIPAFMDEHHDDYDQVIENLIRDDLTPMELARFIQRKVKDGDAKNKIAKRLGKPNDFISVHLALVDMPPAIEAAYEQGKTSTPRYIYDLRSLHDKHPERVAEWIEEQPEITRKGLDLLIQELKGGKKKAPGSSSDEGQGGQGGPGGDFVGTKSEAGEGTGGAAPSGDGEGDAGGDSGPSVQKLPSHNPTHEKALNNKSKDDPDAIKKAVLLVEYDERAAMVLLNRRPSTQGLLHIKYEDNGEEVEVDAGRCKINCLIEASA